MNWSVPCCCVLSDLGDKVAVALPGVRVGDMAKISYDFFSGRITIHNPFMILFHVGFLDYFASY